MGRDSQNDLALPNDSKVSRRHAIVRQVGSTYLIEDLQSRNGTYLERGVTVTRITSPLQLEPNDIIRVGSARLVFDLETAGASAPAAPSPPDVKPAPDATPATPEEAGSVTTGFVVGKTVVGRVVPIMGGPTPFGAPTPERERQQSAAPPAAPAQTAPRTLPEALQRIAELERQVAALEAELARLKGRS